MANDVGACGPDRVEHGCNFAGPVRLSISGRIGRLVTETMSEGIDQDNAVGIRKAIGEPAVQPAL
jgi:hypothetical protein